MNRVQDAVVCESVNELLQMCRNYEQQVIIWPTSPGQHIIGKPVGCVNNTVFINQFTPYQAWTVYVPDSKHREPEDMIKMLYAHSIWPQKWSMNEKTMCLDRLVGFS
jgi:hypothetical protein